MDFASLSADEVAELQLIERVQRDAAARLVARSRLVRPDVHGGGIRIRTVVHVASAAIERQLAAELESAHDASLLARHRVELTPLHDTELATRRLELERALGAIRREVDVRLGHVPTRGADWALASAPDAMRAAASELAARLARTAASLVDSVIDSGLFDLDDSEQLMHASDDVHHLRLREVDSDSVSRATAFCDELARLDDMHVAAIARLRLEARRAEHHDALLAIGQQRDRRARAEQTLDGLRALHAAIAELESSLHRAS